jgi:hypothetical protein
MLLESDKTYHPRRGDEKPVLGGQTPLKVYDTDRFLIGRLAR